MKAKQFISLASLAFCLGALAQTNVRAAASPAKPLVLGRGVGLFKVGPLLARDEFDDLRNWVVQIEPKSGFPQPHVEARNQTLDCLLPGRGCTVWFKQKLKTRLTITYEVLCPTPNPPIEGVQVRDINNFWLASDPLDPELGLFDSNRYTGKFTSYDKMYGYYASTGGGGTVGNQTTRMRRYPREVDGQPIEHIALNDKDGQPGYLITPDKWMTVQLVAYDDVVQYIVDGKLVYEIAAGDRVQMEGRDSEGRPTSFEAIYDLDRFPVYREGYFGFRMVRTHHIYRNFRVYALEPDGGGNEGAPRPKDKPQPAFTHQGARLPIFGTSTNGGSLGKGRLVRRSGHPYLTYSDANIKKLKERIAMEPSIAKAWDRMLAEADRMLENPDRGGRRRGRSMELFCLAYRMTGDKRFGERVKQSLFTHRFGSRSAAMLLRRNPPWHTGLDSGEACAAFGIAYDTVYDLLTPEERQTLARRAAAEGILPVLNDWVLGERRIHALDTMGHNWWSAIVFGAGIGALAILDEDPRAADWVQRVGAADAEWLTYAGSRLENKPANFDRNGGFYESVSYAAYAIGSHLPFRLAWRDAFDTPLPDHPVLDKIADFFIHTCYPRTDDVPMALDFGDSSRTANGARVIPLLWALGYRHPGALWYLRQLQRDDDVGVMRSSPSELLYAPTEEELAAIDDVPDLPRSKIFPDMGWVAMRSSWRPDATLLGVKCGFTWNHAHADAGSFILFHRGKYLLIDSGKCGYANPEYDGYYRQSVAHNVVLFNGRAENPEDTYFGSKFPGAVSHLLDAGDLRYVLADATGPTCDTFIRNFRSFLWIGDVILVIDDLKTFEPGQFEWLLHYDGEGRRDGKDFTVTQDGVRVVVRPLFPMPFPDAGLPTDYPECMRLEERVGLKDHDQHTKMPYAAFLPTERMRRTKFLTAILPVPAGDWEPPKLERLETVNLNGVRITQHGKVTEVWLNLLADGRIRHRNANLVYNGWETDAYLTVQTWPEGADRNDPDAASQLLVIDGSYLRHAGRVVLDSLSKVYLCATRTDDALEVQLQGQPVLNVFLRTPRKPAAIRLNGRPAELDYDPNRQTVRLTIGLK